jgi:hypothetical protein
MGDRLGGAPSEAEPRLRNHMHALPAVPPDQIRISTLLIRQHAAGNRDFQLLNWVTIAAPHIS